MQMDRALAEAIVNRLPSLDDGMAGKVLLNLFGRK
jgi:hypothetical protein